MKKAVVTGGTGFIGSWLIQELLEKDYEVTTVVRQADKLIPEVRSNCIVIQKDLSELLADDFFDTGYDIFYNLAWNGVSSEHKNEMLWQINNITLSMHMLDIAHELRSKLFIASGTVAEYAFNDNVIDVNIKQSPNDMYGAAKASTYYFSTVKARQLGIPFIWLIVPSTFGERRNDGNIITYTIKTLLRGDIPKYGNLTQMWDFLYVAEVVRAMRLIGEKGTPGKIYGIGSGIYKPLKDYIIKIRDIINPKLELGIGELPDVINQTISSCVNIYDLRKDTGFVPRIDFEKGIIKTIQYLKDKD